MLLLIHEDKNKQCLYFHKLALNWHSNSFTLKYLFYILISIVLFSNTLFAQDKNVLEDLDYNKEYTFGFNWNTNGDILGGVSFKYSKFRKGTRFSTYCLEIVSVKHPNEIRPSHDSTINQFVYGKQNYLFVIRPQYGREIVLFRKENEGVQMNFILAGGPSFGIEKPYYVFYGNSASTYQSVPFDPNKTTAFTKTYGSGSYFDGFTESKIVMGINAKASFLFEFGTFRNNLTGLELGFLGEAFSRKIVIMPSESNRSVYFSAFMNIYFGARE